MPGRLCATICATLLFLLFAGVASAQEKPEAPKPKTDRKIFFAGVSLLAASKAADAITTRQLLDRGGWENNPVFGKHPSPAKQAGINLAFFAGQTAGFYFTERTKHAWVRWTGRAFLGAEAADHVKLAVCNARIDPRSPTVQNCRPLLSWWN